MRPASQEPLLARRPDGSQPLFRLAGIGREKSRSGLPPRLTHAEQALRRRLAVGAPALAIHHRAQHLHGARAGGKISRKLRLLSLAPARRPVAKLAKDSLGRRGIVLVHRRRQAALTPLARCLAVPSAVGFGATRRASICGLHGHSHSVDWRETQGDGRFRSGHTAERRQECGSQNPSRTTSNASVARAWLLSSSGLSAT